MKAEVEFQETLIGPHQLVVEGIPVAYVGQGVRQRIAAASEPSEEPTGDPGQQERINVLLMENNDLRAQIRRLEET